MFEKTATELSAMIHKKEVKPSEVCESFLAGCDKNNFAYLDRDAVLKSAKELDGASGASPIFGLPVSLQDNICQKGIPTECGSKMLKNFIPPYDAAIVKNLKNKNAVIFGKLKMEEFGLCEADGLFSVGSFKGGGAVLYKPGGGAVSRYGRIAGSLERIGISARTVSDAALLASAIAGHDPLDAKSDPKITLDFSQIENFDLKEKKIGILDEHVATDFFESAGATAEKASVPLIEDCEPVYHILSLAEASSNLARIDGVSYGHRSEKIENIDDLYINSRTEGFGSAVKQKIWLGTYLLSAGKYELYYEKALAAQVMLKNQLKAAFKKFDFLLLGEKNFEIPVNLTGFPAVALGGLCIIGTRDASLLGAAAAYERSEKR